MAAREDLRAFLRSRRERVTPAQAGLLPEPGPRRVPGLRREELARLAGVSVDYYTRLEQGRDINVSEDVLDAIARALQLADHERAHLFELARPARGRRRPRPSAITQVRPAVRVLLETMQTPAFVVGRRLEMLAANRLALALLNDFDDVPLSERNHARWVFLDPVSRERYVDWESIARDNVATLRMHAGRYPDDPKLAALIGELTVKSPAFAAFWADHEVGRPSHGTKRYRHPDVGELEVAFEVLAFPDDTDQVLYVYTAEPGSPSEQALKLLASWTLPSRRPLDVN